MHIRFVTITKCDNHKMYFSQSAQFQHCFFATVLGTEDYTVEVTLEDDKVMDYICDCPYEGDMCKHVVATLLTIRERKKTEKFSPFFEKIIDNLQINYLRLVLAIKKDNLIYIQPLARSDISRNMLPKLTYTVFSCRFFCITIMD